MKLAPIGVLISLQFLFSVERTPDASGPQPLSGYKLATRLSSFLWSTMPDVKPTPLAAQGKLQDEAVLRALPTRF